MSITLGMLKPSSGGVGPYFISAHTGSQSASAASVSWDHTVTEDTTCIVVGTFVQNDNNSSVMSSVKFNNIAFTRVQGSGSNGGHGAMWVLFNPPVGMYRIVCTPTITGSRGIAGQSMNIGGASEVAASVLGDNNTTNPRTVNLTTPKPGLAIGHLKITGTSTALFVTTSSAPPDIKTAAGPNRFTSNGFAKHNELFYSPTIVPAGPSSWTNNKTTGAINARSMIYAILA